jgi:hypothetical protein
MANPQSKAKIFGSVDSVFASKIGVGQAKRTGRPRPVNPSSSQGTFQATSHDCPSANLHVDGSLDSSDREGCQS